MKQATGILGGVLLILALLGAFSQRIQNAFGENTPLSRQTTITISYTDYEWWLLRWADSAVVCRIHIDHEGLPTADEVYEQCGFDIFQAWEDTPPCVPAQIGSFDTFGCKGLYLHFIGSKPSEKEMVVDLPLASALVNLDGCQPSFPENRCPNIPNLLITGQEPLPNEHILRIEGLYDREPFSCEGDICSIPLRPTSVNGAEVEFWAVSSFGDTSPHYTAQVRVVDAGAAQTPVGGGWYIDVLSSQWQGNPLASCSDIWQAFQPMGGPPLWLSSPPSIELMSSDEPYYYLAGRLISQGVVDASACPTKGLLPNGYADACGLDMARSYVHAWQNQFDAQILQVASETGVPAQLLKNIFAQESQFWPGIFKVPYEYGLGQITDRGADTLLLWDNNFYNQFCPLILTQEACDKGYLKLNADEQAMLRGALAIQAQADCADCPAGIDLTDTSFSVSLFAQTVKANCEQVAQIVYNATKEMPGQVASYEDLWRLTVANYHAGPGCVSYAVHMTWNTGLDLIWENISQNFTEPCKTAIPYVEKVTQ